MNILFLTPRESGKNWGGVERHVRLLTEELRRRGYRVKELNLEEVNKSYKGYKNYKGREGEKDQKDEKEKGKIQRDRRGGKFRAWKYLWDRRELLEWAEVVHVHDVFWWLLPFVPLIWLNKYYKSYKGYKNNNSIKDSPWHSPRRILFTTFHGWEGRCPPTRSAVWQKRLAALLSDGTIGVGNFYWKWYGVRPDRVVWGALAPAVRSLSSEASSLAPESVATAGFGRANGFLREQKSGPVRKVVFFGRLEEVNGVEIVIKAMDRLNKGHKNYKNYKGRERGEKEQKDQRGEGNTGRILFIFVGDGSYREEAGGVGEVTGMVREPWKFLAGAEVVIASSYLAILEAAGMGKPIIAISNNPLKRDYLEGHPLRRYFRVVESSEELVQEITDKSYKSYKNYKENRERAKKWAMKQTQGRLVGAYERLWNSKLV